MAAPDDDAPTSSPSAWRGTRGAPRRRVRVAGTGMASAPPNVVRLEVTLRHGAADVASALRQTTETLSSVGRVVREKGVGDRDISSSGAGVQPRYDHEKQRNDGYESFHRLSVRVRALDSVGEVVEAIAAVAGNDLSVDAISLEIDDRAPLERTARDAAFGDAREKAEQFAALAGASLGPALEVVEGSADHVWVPQSRAMASPAAFGRGMSVEAGEQTVRASVSVTFALDEEPSRNEE